MFLSHNISHFLSFLVVAFQVAIDHQIAKAFNSFEIMSNRFSVAGETIAMLSGVKI